MDIRHAAFIEKEMALMSSIALPDSGEETVPEGIPPPSTRSCAEPEPEPEPDTHARMTQRDEEAEEAASGDRGAVAATTSPPVVSYVEYPDREPRWDCKPRSRRGSDDGGSSDELDDGEQGDPVDSAPLPPALREKPANDETEFAETEFGATDHEVEDIVFEGQCIVTDGPLVPAAGEQGDRANGGTSFRSETVYRASAPSMSEVRTWSSKEAAPPPPPDSKTYYLCAVQGPSEAVQ